MNLSPELTRKCLELAGETRSAKLAEVSFESEAAFQTAFVDLAHTFGYRVAHFRKVRVARKDGSVYWQTPVAADGKGFVDLVCVRERVIWVELKMPDGRVEPDQELWHSALKNAGQEFYLFRPMDWPLIVKVLTSQLASSSTVE